MGNPNRFRHVVTVVCEGRQFTGWENYEIDSDMTHIAGAFSMLCPYSLDAWVTLRLDAEVIIRIDGVTVLRGYIDDREKHGSTRQIMIKGRDKAGRVVQDSAPAINYNALRFLDATKRLVAPWFQEVIESDAQNRALHRGKSHKVPGGKEPLVLNVRAPRAGKVHPGQTRWQVIQQMCSKQGYAAWSTADGTAFFVGKPNYTQAPQYAFVQSAPGSTLRTNVDDMRIEESAGDRYALIRVTGAGGGGGDEEEEDYGDSITDVAAESKDYPFTSDGTGRDFLRPKTLLMPERAFADNGDAQQVAALERARRDFKRHQIAIDAPFHGQWIDSGPPAIFTINTIAQVIEEDTQIDDTYLIYQVKFKADRQSGEKTHIRLIPTGTVIVA